jgi:novobiocin biosynthesis protein NovU/D-mycarose 3-C-methyltransferase
MTIKEVCRLCGEKNREIINLGDSPPANNFLDSQISHIDSFPLILDFCDTCGGFQLRDCLDKEHLYSNYTYLTPDTNSLTEHYKKTVDFLIKNSYIGPSTDCLEIGSNNGRFLHFLKPYVSTVLGVDPAKNVAAYAKELGIETVVDFFSKDTIKKIKNKNRDIGFISARHMFAHNSSPNEIFEGMDMILNYEGVVLIENQYAFETLRTGAFDQIYHEHMFYYSVQNMQNYLNLYSYDLNDILFTSIHGGSIVFIGSRKGVFPVSDNVKKQLDVERELLKGDKLFDEFRNLVQEVKTRTLNEIELDLKSNKKIIAYGAPAKAFTMFSFLEIDNSMIDFCVDTSVTKIGKVFPKSNIPVISENDMKTKDYDTVLITAWNYKNDILGRAESLFKKGTKLVFPLTEFSTYIV